MFKWQLNMAEKAHFSFATLKMILILGLPKVCYNSSAEEQEAKHYKHSSVIKEKLNLN